MEKIPHREARVSISTESIEDLEVEIFAQSWMPRRQGRSSEKPTSSAAADEAREEFGSSMCKRSESALISEPLAFFGDETCPGVPRQLRRLQGSEIVTKWCYSSGHVPTSNLALILPEKPHLDTNASQLMNDPLYRYTVHQPWESYPMNSMEDT